MDRRPSAHLKEEWTRETRGVEPRLPPAPGACRFGGTPFDMRVERDLTLYLNRETTMPTVTSRDGTSIAYTVQGRGPALILVDGALCSRDFGPMPAYSKLLAEHFTVYMYDRRGRNESGDTEPYSVDREVEDIGALIQAAGGRAHLYGTSSGAALVFNAAVRGLPIDRMVLFEAPYTQPSFKPHAEALWALRKANRRGAAVRYFMCDVVGMPKAMGWLFSLFPMMKKLKAVAPTLPYDITVMSDESVWARAGSLKIPTLVIGGGKSPASLKAAVERVAAAIPGAEKIYLEGQTHNVAAAAVLPPTREFLLR